MKSGEGQSAPIQPSTINNYLSSIHQFLIWTARRYIPVNTGKRPASLAHSLAVLEGGFQAARLRGKTFPQVIGLDHSEVADLLDIVQPESPKNPFRRHIRLRNALICETFYQTGIRRGELLKLKVEDLVATPDGNHYVRVIRHPDDAEDWRKNEPAQKTLPRNIAISKELHETLIVYIRVARRPRRQGRPIKLSHSYLFVSERGYPLAESQINYIFSRAGKCLATQATRVHPHALRHTCCEAFMNYCAIVEKIDEAASADRLRKFCGWTDNSAMPSRYTAKRLQRLANEANIKRLNQSRMQLQSLGQT